MTVQEGAVERAPADLPDARPETSGRRRLLPRVPRELTLLLLVVAVCGCTWSLVMPPFQAPDEDVHFAYTQTIVEQGDIPTYGDAGEGGNILSTAQIEAQWAMNNDPVTFGPYPTPEWSQAAYDHWKQEHPGVENDGGGANSASSYPPLYYLTEAIPYLLARSSNVVTELYAMRLFSVIWLLVTTTMVWLIAGEVFGRRRRLQLIAAATVGLFPMLTFMSSGMNPDSMFYAEGAALLWLGTRILGHGITARRAVAFGGVLGLALVTKATALAFIPAVLFVLGFAVVRRWGAPRRALRLAAAAAAVVAFAVPVGAWYAKVSSGDRPAYEQAGLVTGGSRNVKGTQSASGFASYLWQFYLPRLSSMTPNRHVHPVISPYPAYNVWIGTSWGAFAWVTVWFPKWAYWVFSAITLLFLLAALATAVPALRRHRLGALRRISPTFVFYALALGALVGGVHWSEYTLDIPFVQGRYLFPVAAIFGLVAAQATMAARRRWRMPVTAALLGGLVLLQLTCLALVMTRFYA